MSRELTQAELGAMVGLTADRIQKYENGQRNPKKALREKIFKALNIDVSVKTIVSVDVHTDITDKRGEDDK